MSTPVEERLALLESNQTAMATALTSQQNRIGSLETALSLVDREVRTQALRITALEKAYADAVKRFQKAERMTGRLRAILRILWMSTAGDRAGMLAKMDPEARKLAAVELEEIDEIEKITRRESPDAWREPRTR